MQRFIDPETVIMTDFAKMYDTCCEYGFKAHHSVNHSKNFVNPDDPNIHTQNVERQWRGVKEAVKSYGSGYVDNLSIYQYKDRYFKKPYLAFYEQNKNVCKRKRRVKNSIGDHFKQFLQHMALVYPGPGIEGLSLGDFEPCYADVQDVVVTDNIDVDPLCPVQSLEFEPDCELPLPDFDPDRTLSVSSPFSVELSPQGLQPQPPSFPQDFHCDVSPVFPPTSLMARATSTYEYPLAGRLVDHSLVILRALIVNKAYNDVQSVHDQLVVHMTFIDEILAQIWRHQPPVFGTQPNVTCMPRARHIPASFNAFFARISRVGNGDCWYNAVSTCLLGCPTLAPCIRLATLHVASIHAFELLTRVVADKSYNNDPRLALLGIGTPSEMMAEIHSTYSPLLLHLTKQKHQTINWATEIVQPFTSLAIQRPIYCYQVFASSTLSLSAEELELQFILRSNSTLGHLKIVGNGEFCKGPAIRIYFEAAHFEALISRDEILQRCLSHIARIYFQTSLSPNLIAADASPAISCG